MFLYFFVAFDLFYPIDPTNFRRRFALGLINNDVSAAESSIYPAIAQKTNA
jgi:hypothetical protein